MLISTYGVLAELLLLAMVPLMLRVVFLRAEFSGNDAGVLSQKYSLNFLNYFFLQSKYNKPFKQKDFFGRFHKSVTDQPTYQPTDRQSLLQS